ncbi:cell wall hydrolase [Hydrogenispora ethanolica]|jgi:N-acetylmuramoyl-L-alanine amidase|uniref:Cell wall hydrolase n=1 Tax=Hydrogenispora ethanolica TaxID=1082276 RepID=A0A4V2QGQ6_HYDET|nr:cell wall hydrolase [Hydrogenispora ethanolica]
MNRNLKTGRLLLIPFLIGGLMLGVWAVQAQPAPSRASGDTELLARVIRAEAEAEPYTGQVAVGAVILNRIQSSKFPKTIAGVVYQPHAFESVSNGQINRTPTPSCRKAARDAISGWDPSGGALFFFNAAKVKGPSYVWTRRIIQRIGKHSFAL